MPIKAVNKMKKKVKKRKQSKLNLKKQKGQSLPFVLMVGAVMSLLAFSLANLLRYESRAVTKYGCITQKQELAAIALEHSLYKLQQGSNWNTIPESDNSVYRGYSNEFITDMGSYWVNIEPGNLFLNDPDDSTTRQNKINMRTVGIKVKTSNTECTGKYYAVVERSAYGGPLISKGRINFPCSDDYAQNAIVCWGDIYSASKDKDACRIPLIPVGEGNYHPQPWMPRVYAKNAIYTAVHGEGTRTGATYDFAYVYEDMSPTAHCHPFSEYAVAPELDMDYFKMLAKRNNAYYGPANIGGEGPNPYFINDGLHDLNDVTNSNVPQIMSKLSSLSSVLFIDTTDALPVRRTTGSVWNTYTTRVTPTAGDGSDGTLRFYLDQNNQYMTTGMCFVMGPLIVMGNDPDDIGNNYGYSWSHGRGSGSVIESIWPPDNYYYPQHDFSPHYTKTGSLNTSKLNDIKHHGLLYVNGELRIGGTPTGCTTGRSGTCETSDVAIYGTVYIGEHGQISLDTTNDEPMFYLFYDSGINVFGFTGTSVKIMSFNEITFLLPETDPVTPF